LRPLGQVVPRTSRRLDPVVLAPHVPPFLVFSFHSPPDHRDLHSFPTRRSSDLGHIPCSSFPFRGQMRRQGRPSPHTGRGLADALDRKSTRLNSSHVSISYAVFCLKKKKIEAMPG